MNFSSQDFNMVTRGASDFDLSLAEVTRGAPSQEQLLPALRPCPVHFARYTSFRSSSSHGATFAQLQTSLSHENGVQFQACPAENRVYVSLARGTEVAECVFSLYSTGDDVLVEMQRRSGESALVSELYGAVSAALSQCTVRRGFRRAPPISLSLLSELPSPSAPDFDQDFEAAVCLARSECMRSVREGVARLASLSREHLHHCLDSPQQLSVLMELLQFGLPSADMQIQRASLVLFRALVEHASPAQLEAIGHHLEAAVQAARGKATDANVWSVLLHQQTEQHLACTLDKMQAPLVSVFA